MTLTHHSALCQLGHHSCLSTRTRCHRTLPHCRPASAASLRSAPPPHAGCPLSGLYLPQRSKRCHRLPIPDQKSVASARRQLSGRLAARSGMQLVSVLPDREAIARITNFGMAFHSEDFGTLDDSCAGVVDTVEHCLCQRRRCETWTAGQARGNRGDVARTFSWIIAIPCQEPTTPRQAEAGCFCAL
jgi:hypothetical protein